MFGTRRLHSAYLIGVIALGIGCTHRQLTKHTALTATTVNSIQYRMVLDNIAMFSCQPEAMPGHVRLADGTVQISNQTGIGESGGFTWPLDNGLGIEQFGPSASTKVSEQWGTDAVEDPIQVFELQTIYRKAFALPPLEEPNFIIAAKLTRASSQQKDSKASNGESSDKSSAELNANSARVSKNRLATLAYDESPSELNFNDECGSQSQEDALKNLSAADFDIPTGWFMIGRKQDVPKNACYVGRYYDRYAWVTADGVGCLAKFTLAVLTITKIEAGETKGKSGLMFTP